MRSRCAMTDREVSNCRDVCACERRGEKARVECLKHSVYQFYKRRRQLHLYPRRQIDNANQVLDIGLDEAVKHIDNITNRASESCILLNFLQKFSTRHPKFATETASLEFVKCVELFKEL